MFFIGDGYGKNGLSNGVMWTLILDMFFYIITPVIYKIMKKAAFLQGSLIIFFFWLFNVFDNQIMGLFGSFQIPYNNSIGLFLCLLYEFLIGSFLYFHFDIVSKISNPINGILSIISFSLLYYL